MNTLSLVKYPNVVKGHIVPAVYLRNFAVDGKITQHTVADGLERVRKVEKVGTRLRPYRRLRPDGTPIDDIEWSLSELEGIAAPVLREFDDRWPLDDDGKQKLAELFAFQLLRGPRFKAEHQARTKAFLDEHLPADGAEEAEENRTAELLQSDSYRLIRMMVTGMTLTSILVSTHWTLVEFDAPLLATSDHPVFIWRGAEPMRPQPVSIFEAGALECMEYRLPLSPTRGVLMTWMDKADDEDARVAGGRQHAMNFNAFTIANAEREWFTRPGTSAPRAAGIVRPLSPELVRGYTPEAAAHSERRAQVSAHVQEKVGRDLTDREVIRVKATARRSGEPSG